ncbi:Poly(A)-specific ribonuclease PARN-like domain-containing protein 1 [Orchesella cincta]|uniref:Poly(A)-specific ribonuclease PARN-like domain-containing protein 1 n=1 Tax=Orchesella cincta TaxID=48709 RepID=A0A1D2MHU3_ORCCI|nr:Poly(A)-specific ribonuclease PARN-like domain-containing protein 1 [Orchesella cincta]
MEVTRSNYLEILPKIVEKLEGAAFISFDAEYTGLKFNDGKLASLFDDIVQRYEKLRRVVLSNSAPQFGISIFHRINEGENCTEQIYSVDAYSFHLAEACFADFNMTKIKASVDTECCQFLKEIKFDYNRWLRNSVPYLNNKRTEELKEYLDKNPNFMEKCSLEERPLDKTFFPETVKVVTPEHKNEIIQRLRGFSTIVDVISERKIPVVGHNMILDLMYFFQQFCSDLPEQYVDFKAEVVKFLPIVFDTKYMTVRCRKMLKHPSLKHSKKDLAQLDCSGLYVIYNASSSVTDKYSPVFMLSENCQYFQVDLERGKTMQLDDMENANLCHEPSFDACVTGIVFLNLAHIACRMDKELLTSDCAPTMEKVMFSVRHLQDQIFIARASMKTMCLKGEDPRPIGSWLKICVGNGRKIDIKNIFDTVQSVTQQKLSGVDYEEVSDQEVLFAVARIQSAKEMSAILQQSGYEVTNTLIPWDKKRYVIVEKLKTDDVYDTWRNKFLH